MVPLDATIRLPCSYLASDPISSGIDARAREQKLRTWTKEDAAEMDPKPLCNV